MPLDMSTVYLMTVTLSFSLGLLMLVIGFVHRHHPYLRTISFLHLLAPIGLFLAPLRQVIPEIFSTVLSNVLIGLWPILIIYALRQMTGQRFNPVFYILGVALFAGHQIYATEIDYNTKARILGYNLYIAVFVSLAIYNFACRGPVPFTRLKSRADILAAIFFLSWYLITVVARTWYTWHAGAEQDYLQSGSTHALFVILMNSALHPLSVTLMWIWMREIDANLKAQAAELKAAHKQSETLRLEAEQAALHDPLTGLGNRRKFDRDVEEEFERVKRFSHPLSLLLLDLDHFKTVNDRFGHGKGDEVLVNLSKLLTVQTRSTDRIYRFGGEEFVIMMPETNLDVAEGLAARIRVSVEEKVSCKDHRVTVSIGATAYRGQGDNTTALVERADKLLYRAKAEGRNRVCVDKDFQVGIQD